jgi:CRISPR-associated protein Csb2
VIGLAVTFDLGRAHATPWGTHVNEAVNEWPPSPWRIMRALLAASYAHADLLASRPVLRRALATLAAAPPPVYIVPPATPAHTRHYYPLPAWSPSASDKTSLVVDAFLAIDPTAELYVCWEADLRADERDMLERAAAAVGYLGRSESVCTVRVVDALPGEPNAVPAETPADWGDTARRVDLWCVSPEHVDALETSIADLRRAKRLVPDGVLWVPYLVREPQAVSVAARSTADDRPTLAHLRIRGSARPALVDTIEVAHVLRAALQRRFDVFVGGGRSPILSGHTVQGTVRRDQHQHAHYLVGSDPGQRRADHLWIWAPGGLGPDELGAIASLRELRFRDAPEPCRVALVALGDEHSLTIPHLIGPSTIWRSVTPFVLTRHQKIRAGKLVDSPIEQIERELAHRGLPRPADIELIPGAWSTFKLTRPGVSRRSARRSVGALIRFHEPVAGPIALGRYSHFGLGRFEPAP